MKKMMGKYDIGEIKSSVYSQLTDNMTSVGQFCIRLVSSAGCRRLFYSESLYACLILCIYYSIGNDSDPVIHADMPQDSGIIKKIQVSIVHIGSQCPVPV